MSEAVDLFLELAALPTPSGDRLMVEVAAGARADDFAGLTYPIDNTMAEFMNDAIALAKNCVGGKQVSWVRPA